MLNHQKEYLQQQGFVRSDDLAFKEVVILGDETYVRGYQGTQAVPEVPKFAIYCTECGAVMDIESVCPKAKWNIHKYQCCTACQKCVHYEYHKESSGVVMKNRGVAL
jgi:hypothetical protein